VSSYTGCKKAKEPKAINSIRIKQHVSYSEATQIRKQEQQVAAPVENNNPTNVNIPQPRPAHQMAVRKVLCDSSCQTDPDCFVLQNTGTDTSTDDLQHGDTVTQTGASISGSAIHPSDIGQFGTPNEKMCAFIIECITSLTLSKSQLKSSEQQQGDILSGIAKKVYGKGMNSYKISEFLKQNKDTKGNTQKRPIRDNSMESASDTHGQKKSKS
jgi:nucleoid-associated protein YgaU